MGGEKGEAKLAIGLRTGAMYAAKQYQRKRLITKPLRLMSPVTKRMRCQDFTCNEPSCRERTSFLQLSGKVFIATVSIVAEWALRL